MVLPNFLGESSFQRCYDTVREDQTTLYLFCFKFHEYSQEVQEIQVQEIQVQQDQEIQVKEIKVKEDQEIQVKVEQEIKVKEDPPTPKE